MNCPAERHCNELALQKEWEHLDRGKNYFTECNCRLEVRSTGYRNREAGPDFKNAGIAINGKALVGDIEIHVRASDWFAHGHHHDSNYQRVILHVVAKNDLPQKKRELLPPMMVLDKRLDCCRNIPREPDFGRGRCSAIFSNLGAARTRKLLTEAGLLRFRRKSADLLEKMLLIGAENGFWQCIFEAAGYKQNRCGFLELFKRFSDYPDDVRKKYYPAILWGESGLLPDPATSEVKPPMRALVKDYWEQWWSIRREVRQPIHWRHSGVRPVNSPARRLAALLRYHERFGEKPLKYLHEQLDKEQFTPNQLLKLFQVNCPLWDQYADFTTPLKSPAAIGGSSFALELLVNIVLPAIHAAAKLEYFKDSENAVTMEQIEYCWRQLPPTQENTVTRKAGHLWFGNFEQKNRVLNSAVARQGALHLWRKYCEPCQSDCSSCRFFNSF